MRFLANLLVLLVVASSVLAAVPCACEAQDTHSETDESEDTRSCCKGSTEKADNDDCPHCLTGACEVDSVTVDDEHRVATAPHVLLVIGVQRQSAAGFEPGVGWTASAAHDGEAFAAQSNASGWDTCVRNQVIRC